MNYYEHHIGDYAKDAGYLSMIEDGAFRRLLDAYYTREAPLPTSAKDCCKLARASSKAERDAVVYVLGEFFELREDGHHQKRCDEEIERFQLKSEKARRSANARWGSIHPDSEGNANASSDVMRTHIPTHCEGNAPRARPQSPVTSNQEKPRAEEREKPTEPNQSPKSRPQLSLDTWLAQLGDGDAIPEDDPIWSYADQTGIPEEFVILAWETFASQMRDRGKRQRDWRAHFRNAVKRNWFKLWWFPATGGCELTTTGIQARRAAEAQAAA